MSFPVLRVSCADRPGLVQGITGVLVKFGANIVRNDEFVDRLAKRFFMRTAFENVAGNILSDLEKSVRAAIPDAQITLSLPHAKKIAVLCTKEYHCLGDLLLRNHFGELDAQILAVISNHNELHDLVSRFGVAFHCVSHEHTDRDAHEDSIIATLENYDLDYLVLAKYMRILSPKFVEKYAERIINIHHSFLPAFIGTKPYHQAHARGVKMIGATAHFVTDTLDEGPIIAQEIVAVDHTMGPSELVAAGREIETKTLAKALKLVFSDRVFIDGNKTVVF